jgi:hypothetical protein
MNAQTEQQMNALDAWIAERVMGWKRVGTVYDLGSVRGAFAVSRSGDCYVPVRGNNIEMWHPTQNKAQAMDVLAKCIAVENVAIKEQARVFEVSCYKGGDLISLILGETLPIAICLFAKNLFGKEGQ